MHWRMKNKSRFWVLMIMMGAIVWMAHAAEDEGEGETSSDNKKLRSKGLILTKVWCLMIAFAATFVSGVSPYFLRWNSWFLVFGTQFAGGVFLATALMHFLADANEAFQDRTHISYPFAFMLATFGYLLTMLTDCIIALVYSRSSKSKLDVEDPTEKEHVKHANFVTASAIVKEATFGDSLLLVIALCFHSIFEGIAIGVAGDEDDAWRNLWTICLHKLFAAVAMGIALLNILPNRPLISTISYAFAFAISTPVGVAIGIIIDSTVQGAIADWIYAIAMAIACGVFIYVAINHLLTASSAADKPVIRFLSVVTGAGLIAIVMIWD